MKPRSLLLLAAALASSCLPASAGLLSILLPHHQIQVITNGDVHPAGRGLPAASPDAPIYYIAVSTGFRDYGAAVAGEKIPDSNAVMRAMTKTLANQGYKLATNKNPPQVIIVYGWGTMNTERWLIGANGYSPVLNQYQILRFLGAGKLGLPTRGSPEIGDTPVGLSFANPGLKEFFDLGQESYYIISLTAFDINAAAAKKAVPLWSTKIGCPSIGFTLEDVMPAMLSIAAPNIGKQTTRPVIVNADDRYKPTIEIGPARVIEEDVAAPDHR
ncbi:hypothetical protein DB347_14055 [Opitutaceae bacterium EW11]|nr:hypothetical protein DB347_14055 [Opitutaceae bacterium EW11]